MSNPIVSSRNKHKLTKRDLIGSCREPSHDNKVPSISPPFARHSTSSTGLTCLQASCLVFATTKEEHVNDRQAIRIPTNRGHHAQQAKPSLLARPPGELGIGRDPEEGTVSRSNPDCTCTSLSCTQSSVLGHRVILIAVARWDDCVVAAFGSL